MRFSKTMYFIVKSGFTINLYEVKKTITIPKNGT